MPETRYRPETSYPEGMAARDKILENGKTVQVPYEVSDEELADEAEVRAINTYIDTLPEMNPMKRVLRRLRDKGRIS